MKVRRESDGVVVAEDCALANTMLSRVIGLLKHKLLLREEALWIIPCNSIHTFFMRFTIDAIFLDRNFKIISIYKEMKPWRMSCLYFSAYSVLELAGGVADDLQLEVGQSLLFEEPSNGSKISNC